MGNETAMSTVEGFQMAAVRLPAQIAHALTTRQNFKWQDLQVAFRQGKREVNPLLQNWQLNAISGSPSP